MAKCHGRWSENFYRNQLVLLLGVSTHSLLQIPILVWARIKNVLVFSQGLSNLMNWSLKGNQRYLVSDCWRRPSGNQTWRSILHLSTDILSKPCWIAKGYHWLYTQCSVISRLNPVNFPLNILNPHQSLFNCPLNPTKKKTCFSYDIYPSSASFLQKTQDDVTMSVHSTGSLAGYCNGEARLCGSPWDILEGCLENHRTNSSLLRHSKYPNKNRVRVRNLRATWGNHNCQNTILKGTNGGSNGKIIHHLTYGNWNGDGQTSHLVELYWHGNIIELIHRTKMKCWITGWLPSGKLTMCDGKPMGKSSLRGKSSMTGQFPIAMIVYSMVCGSTIDSADFWSEKIRNIHDSTMKKKSTMTCVPCWINLMCLTQTQMKTDEETWHR